MAHGGQDCTRQRGRPCHVSVPKGRLYAAMARYAATAAGASAVKRRSAPARRFRSLFTKFPFENIDSHGMLDAEASTRWLRERAQRMFEDKNQAREGGFLQNPPRSWNVDENNPA